MSKKTTIALHDSMQHLSSGFRINSAMDDVAGLSISERFRAKMRGLSQSTRNASAALNAIQTAEGAMNQIADMVIRMRELSVQASSDSVTNTDRGIINTEYTELTQEIDRLTKSVKFNDQVLLDGSFSGRDFQVAFEKGTTSDSIVQVTIAAVDSAGLGFAGSDLSSKANAQTAMQLLDGSLDVLNDRRATLGAKANRLSTAMNVASVLRDNLSAANSLIRDTDIAAETSNFTAKQILLQAGMSMLSQANAAPQNTLKLLV